MHVKVVTYVNNIERFLPASKWKGGSRGSQQFFSTSFSSLLIKVGYIRVMTEAWKEDQYIYKRVGFVQQKVKKREDKGYRSHNLSCNNEAVQEDVSQYRSPYVHFNRQMSTER